MRIFQAWGMTETSPVATYSRPREREHDDAYWDDRAKQGRPLPWVELRLVDDDGDEVPWDGESTGEIEVRGPWIAARYFRDDSGDEKFDAGWLRTGDIAAVDENGFVQITDRSKDVIKSGGEWISSVELENELMAHPDVVEAAVIAKPDERWAERPLCCVVLREQADASADRAGRAPARAGREVVAARRVRVHRGDPQDERRQVRQEGAARPARRGRARGARASLVSALERSPSGKSACEHVCATARGDRPSAMEGRRVPANGEPETMHCHSRASRQGLKEALARGPKRSHTPPNGGWHDSDRCHGLEQATDSRHAASTEERNSSRIAPADGPPRADVAHWRWRFRAPRLAAEPTSDATTRPRLRRRRQPRRRAGHLAVERSRKTDVDAGQQRNGSGENEQHADDSSEKASTLPFTGFDLRWDVGFGLLLMARDSRSS